ncbi:MAG: 23S rRNA pseudouridine(2605) synthase RluB [Gammaproteobacteria bacterium]|nr:23S rRNA pseudouridine(2605) synthase RluB [Gammaproteobacteria bacterium]
MSEKLQKVLARAGYASRREIEAWIEAGRITLNDVTATVGARATPQDKILIDGQPVPQHRLSGGKCRVLAYHKPVGEICTRDDPEQRTTVFTQLPVLRSARWITIGRLDINTSGLLLLTTDGELAHRLMHPSREIEREYAVRVLGEVDADMLQRLQRGVMLEDGMAHFTSIVDAGGEGANHWYHVVLKEGRKHEVRRLWESQGLKVSRLTRVRYGDILLARSLRRGQHKDLTPEEINSLRELAGLEIEPIVRVAEKPRSGQRQRPQQPGAAHARHRSRGG